MVTSLSPTNQRGISNDAFTPEPDDTASSFHHSSPDTATPPLTSSSPDTTNHSLSRDSPRDVCGCRWPCRQIRTNFAVSACRKTRSGGGRGLTPRAVAIADRNAATCSQATTRHHRNTDDRRINRAHTVLTIENNTVNSPTTNNTVLNPELLPDILNSHLPPPPYSTLPQSTERSSRRGAAGNSNVNTALCPNRSFLNPRLSFLAGGVSGRRGRATNYTPEDEPKHCCGVVVSQTVSIRWFIIMIAFVGLCCAVVGTVLGALKTTGREHLTVSLLMIGVGIVLITVSGIAWRLTSTDAPSCRMMLGLRSNEDPEPNRRFVPRIPPSYGRPHHPYAAMLYPEFQFRPPPPSYQASMQEYRLRLLLLDRQHTPTVMSPVSPPPTYRSHTSNRQPLTLTRDSEYSRPPSYRSRTSSVLPTRQTESATATGGEAPVECHSCHSRDPSLSLSCLSHESLFEVRPLTVSPLPQTRDETVINIEGDRSTIPVKYVGNEERMGRRESRSNNNNTNSDGSQVISQDGVVVTVSTTSSPAVVQGEVEILAHL